MDCCNHQCEACHKHKERTPEEMKALINRLNRIEGAGARHPRHGGEQRVLPGYSHAGRRNVRRPQRVHQGAACQPYPHLRGGGYPRWA